MESKEQVIEELEQERDQAKNQIKAYVQKIEHHEIYSNQRLSEYQNQDMDQILIDNQNLRVQNRQLLVILMNHLTNINKKIVKKKKRKNKFGATILTNSKNRKQMYIETSSKRRSKIRNRSHNKRYSSKRK